MLLQPPAPLAARPSLGRAGTVGGLEMFSEDLSPQQQRQ
jgi:hypothetical protein